MQKTVMILCIGIIIPAFAVAATAEFLAYNLHNTHGLPIPPKLLHQRAINEDTRSIAEQVEAWTPENEGNVWELSGLFEGDIMFNPADAEMVRNGLLNKSKRWPNGIVPIYIDDEDFNEEEIKQIKEAIKEYHQRTCLKFRPYQESDDDYITIKGATTGCWSSVGRQGKGQILNLQKKGCMKHGTIVHELLHALGFYHQQSAADRDEYVRIHWDNIKRGKIYD